MQNNVNLMFKLKVLWRTQSLSHEIQIKNHSFKYNSLLEQTYNLIGKAQILEKNAKSLDNYRRKIIFSQVPFWTPSP